MRMSKDHNLKIHPPKVDMNQQSKDKEFTTPDQVVITKEPQTPKKYYPNETVAISEEPKIDFHTDHQPCVSSEYKFEKIRRRLEF